jgi:hypothetical protein
MTTSNDLLDGNNDPSFYTTVVGTGLAGLFRIYTI